LTLILASLSAAAAVNFSLMNMSGSGIDQVSFIDNISQSERGAVHAMMQVWSWVF
jgi:hypothetical protein